jgi:phosphoenolpyruvate synthase/pyruvate phosphate dikinase
MKYLEGIDPWIQETSGKLHYAWYVPYAGTRVLKTIHGRAFKIIGMIVKEGRLKYWYDKEDMILIGKDLFEKEIEKTGYTDDLIKKWKKLSSEFYEICKKIEKTDLKKISKDELANIYEKFKDSYIEEYALGLLTDAVGVFLEEEIKKALSKISDKKKMNYYFITLTEPLIPSFISQEQYELYKLALNKKNLEEHQKKWYWIQNDYYRSIILKKEYFAGRIKEHLKNIIQLKDYIKKYEQGSKEILNNKEKIFTELKSDKKFRILIMLAEKYINFQDLRKKANLIADHYITLFLDETKRRTKSDLLEHTTGDELLEIIKKEEISEDFKEILKKRKEINGLLFTPEKTDMLNYEETLELEKEFQQIRKEEETDELFGHIASTGKIIAEVSVISGPSEFHKMKKGNIIVTSMTRPEFMPILKDASGIITNEGGITCHAAIVSRELNTPCIVGTQIATQILKDGDLVELNANHGVIKILKRT